jgi:hypothetical protein
MQIIRFFTFTFILALAYYYTTTTTTTTTMSSTTTSTDAYLEAVKLRRSVYHLSDKTSVSEDRVEEIVKQAILHTPSSL